MALLQKVAVLVTRPGADGLELLVFEHIGIPAGLQVPAGTVEPGEDVRAAALRELVEEIGPRGGRRRAAVDRRRGVRTRPDGRQ